MCRFSHELLLEKTLKENLPEFEICNISTGWARLYNKEEDSCSWFKVSEGLSHHNNDPRYEASFEFSKRALCKGDKVFVAKHEIKKVDNHTCHIKWGFFEVYALRKSIKIKKHHASSDMFFKSKAFNRIANKRKFHSLEIKAIETLCAFNKTDLINLLAMRAFMNSMGPRIVDIDGVSLVNEGLCIFEIKRKMAMKGNYLFRDERIENYNRNAYRLHANWYRNSL